MIRMRREFTTAFLLFLLWVVGFSILFYFVGFNDVIRALESVNLNYYSSAFVFVVLSVLMSIFNLRAVLFIMGYRVSLKNIFRIMMVGFFIDSILPNIAPAGEFSIAYLLSKKEKIPITSAFNAIIAHTAGWFIGFVLFGLVSLTFLVFFNHIPFFLVVIILLLLLCFIGLFLIILYLILKPKIAEKLIVGMVKGAFMLLRFTRLKPLKQKIITYVEENIRSFTYSFRKQGKKKRLVLMSSIVLMIHHFFVAFSFYLVIISMGISVSAVEAIGMFLIIDMISLLSMVPGQFAIYESIAIPLVYTKAGIVSSVVIVGLVRLIHYWFIVFLGGFFAFEMGFKKRIKKVIES